MNSFASIIRILKAFAFAAVSTVILLVAFAAICSIADISESAVRPVTFCITALSVFLWAFISARGAEKGGLAHGGAAGILYGAVFALISVIYCGGMPSVRHLVTMALAVIAAGALGGVVGINTAK